MDDKQKAAMKRAKVASDHLERARIELDAACSDLGAVINANAMYTAIRKLSMGVLSMRQQLDREANGSYAASKPWMLDHDPTPQELHCGHGPKHGCGKGKRR